MNVSENSAINGGNLCEIAEKWDDRMYFWFGILFLELMRGKREFLTIFELLKSCRRKVLSIIWKNALKWVSFCGR